MLVIDETSVHCPTMPTLEELLADAERKRRAGPRLADYWQGYIAGLRIGHYGLEIGADEELEANEQYVAGRGDGYHAGLMAETGSVN
jgi:hypothetical protein